MRDVLLRLEILAAWLKPGGAYPDEPIPDKYSTLVEAVGEIKRLRKAIAEGAAPSSHHSHTAQGE